MLKILSVIASFLFGKQMSSGPSYEDLVDYAFERLRSIVNSAAIGLSGIVLVITGFIFTTFNLLNQYDQHASVAMTAVAAGGLVLCVVGLGFILFASRKTKTPLEKSEGLKTHHPAASPLEEALSLLVMDFVKARQEDREQERHKNPEYSTDHFNHQSNETFQ